MLTEVDEILLNDQPTQKSQSNAKGHNERNFDEEILIKLTQFEGDSIAIQKFTI